MADDVTPTDGGGTPIARRRRPITEAERQQALAELVLRDSKLDDEEALILGDVFGIVYRAFLPRVWSRLSRMGLSEAEAQDESQEFFEILFKRVRANGFPASLPKVVSALLKERFLGYVRDQGRERVSVGLASSLREAPKTGPGVETTAHMRALAARLLAQLSADHRDVFVLVDVNGLEYKEAAELLGIHLETLKSRLAAARRRLLELAEEIPEDERPKR